MDLNDEREVRKRFKLYSGAAYGKAVRECRYHSGDTKVTWPEEMLEFID